MILLDVIKGTEEQELLESTGLHGRKRRRRHLAMVHIIVIGLVWIGIGLIFRRVYMRRQMEFGREWATGILSKMEELSPRRDGEVIRCISPSQWFHVREAQPSDSQAPLVFSSDYLATATTSLDIPDTYTSLLFLSNGGKIQGTFDVMPSEDLDAPRVEIQYRYNDLINMFERVSVCLRRTKDGGAKIELSASSRPQTTIDPLHAVRFNVVVKIPRNGSHPYVIPEFGTNLPFFAQTVHDFGDAVEFRRLTLQSALAPVEVHAVKTRTANIITSEADVVGRFVGVQTLQLLSINGQIDADVEMQDGGDVLMETTNGAIHSHINLTSAVNTPSLRSGPVFNVTARTSHGGANISFPEFVTDARLRLYVQATGGPVQVELNPGFEGTFATWAPSQSVRVRTDGVTDPTGQGRRREYWMNEIGERACEGGVSWGVPTGPSGSVHLRTLSPNVTLVI